MIKLKLSVAILLIIVLGYALEAKENLPTPKLSVLVGTVRASEDNFGKKAQNQTEYSLMTPIFSREHLRITSGISYWNQQETIYDTKLTLTNVVIPLRVAIVFPVYKNWTLATGVQGGMGVLLEDYQVTESYVGLGGGVFVGVEYSKWKHYMVLFEYQNFKANYKLLENLDTGLESYRIGIGYRL